MVVSCCAIDCRNRHKEFFPHTFCESIGRPANDPCDIDYVPSLFSAYKTKYRSENTEKQRQERAARLARKRGMQDEAIIEELETVEDVHTNHTSDASIQTDPVTCKVKNKQTQAGTTICISVASQTVMPGKSVASQTMVTGNLPATSIVPQIVPSLPKHGVLSLEHSDWDLQMLSREQTLELLYQKQGYK